MQSQQYQSPFMDYDFMNKIGLDNLKKYPQNTTLFSEEDQYRGVYLLVDGKVKISKGNKVNQTLLWLASSKELIGINAHITESPYTYSAITITDSTGFFISKNKFDSIIKDHPEIKSDLMKFLSRRINFLEHRTADIQFDGTKKRFINFLLTLSDAKTKLPMKLDLSLLDIASLIDTTEYYLIKIVNELKAKEIIAISKNSLSILNYKKLSQI